MANTPQAKKRIRRNNKRAEVNGAPVELHAGEPYQAPTTQAISPAQDQLSLRE